MPAVLDLANLAMNKHVKGHILAAYLGGEDMPLLR